jgi:hypothetical protein
MAANGSRETSLFSWIWNVVGGGNSRALFDSVARTYSRRHGVRTGCDFNGPERNDSGGSRDLDSARGTIGWH